MEQKNPEIFIAASPSGDASVSVNTELPQSSTADVWYN